MCALGCAAALGACAGSPADKLFADGSDQNAGMSFVFGPPPGRLTRAQEQAIIARAILEHETRHP